MSRTSLNRMAKFQAARRAIRTGATLNHKAVRDVRTERYDVED